MDRNTDLFFEVAEAIEKHPQRYDQRSCYGNNECGTTACIAGWTLALTEHQGDLTAADRAYDSEIFSPAGDALGLSEYEAEHLFDAWWKPHDGLSVPDALRKIGEGAEIEDVSK